MRYRKALTTTKGKMNVLDELDAICSEKLLSLEKEFDSLVAHADFDLFDPTSFNRQPQNSAFTSSASESSVCILGTSVADSQ